MNKKFTLIIFALGALTFLHFAALAQETESVQGREKVQLPIPTQAYAPESSESAATRAYEAKALEIERQAVQQEAKETQKYYRGLEKEAKKEERNALRVEKEIKRAEKAEQDALKARARADKQHNATRNAIDRYLGENGGQVR